MPAISAMSFCLSPFSMRISFSHCLITLSPTLAIDYFLSSWLLYHSSKLL
uniref:Uncharacterized protein n=1 Tax=Siphoviridae sp. ct4Am4 TaxID=2826287 RepID=A0A8S5R0S6_9CAUD|nr:MAG TPA: hypothetical protein [Siphoviridae sp. ct4Am4]